MPKRKKGTGSVCWSVAQDRFVGAIMTAGKRRYVYGSRGDQSEHARRATIERLNALAANRGVSRFTIAAYAAHYIETAPIREKTKQWYRDLYRAHVDATSFSRMELRAIEPRHVRAFFASLRVGATTQRGIYALLRRVCQVALESDELTVNPFAAVKKPAKPRRPERPVWSPEESLAFLRIVRRHRLYALFVLALTTTMGPGELFGLQRASVSLKGSYVVVRNDLVDVAGKLLLEETKNPKRMRRLTLNAVQVDALRARLEAALAEGANAFVFTTSTGKPISRAWFYRRVWRPAIERAAAVTERYARMHGRPDYQFARIRPYDMRHTANALMAHLGIPIQVASRRMGHSSILMTVDTYGHLYAEADQAVADRLQEFLAPLKRA